jgi:serine/threonine protein kinase
VLTASGVLVGTPEYGSPEQAQSKPADARSDIYSLGVLMFAMLTAQLPFHGSSKVTLMMAHVKAPIPRVSDRGVTLDPDLDDLVERMMAKSATDRPQTMAEIRDILDELQERTLITGDALPRVATVEPSDTSIDHGPPASLVDGATRWLKRLVKQSGETFVDHRKDEE